MPTPNWESLLSDALKIDQPPPEDGADSGADMGTRTDSELHSHTDPTGSPDHIAVVGVSATVAETSNADELWEALRGEADLIRKFPEVRVKDADHLKVHASGVSLGEISSYGYLERIDLFDPDRFAISPHEARLMEPHQRLFLSAALEAAEDAGYGGKCLQGTRTGVYVGAGATQGIYLSGFEPSDPASAGMATSGKLTSLIAGRVSHHLDLRGPAVVTDTACSSSMSAFIQACRDIRSGVVDAAIAGGVRLTLVPPEVTETSFGIESSSSRTKTFSAASDGTGGGEGVIAFLLKPLASAVSDGDHIYGVVRGFAMNHDGTSLGVTAPNAGAQSEVLRSAWRDAEVSPEELTYIEAHGTATVLGDPVEINGITEAMDAYTRRRQFCGIGSIKTNIGHLDAAAGVAGILKVLLMLRHREIPASKHFHAPNPKIDFAQSPVYVAARTEPWNSDGPLIAGVSSFGISGTNGHIVLEEAPSTVEGASGLGAAKAAKLELIVLTATDRRILVKNATILSQYLEENPENSLADISLTLGAGRDTFAHRCAILADSVPDLVDALRSLVQGEADSRVYTGEVHVVASQSKSDGDIDSSRVRELTLTASQILDQIGVDKANPGVNLVELAKLSVSGADIDFARMFDQRRARRVPLPVYAGSQRRIWRTDPPISRPDRAPVIHPLVHRYVAQTPDFDVFESELSAQSCFELGEHRINGVNVLVGTALIEMATVISEFVKGGICSLGSLHYRDPLVTYGDEVRHLQCVVTHRDDESLELEFRSRLDGQGPWVEHCRVLASLVDEAVSMAGAGFDRKKVDVAGLLESYELYDSPLSYNRELLEADGRYWGSSQAVYFGPEGQALLKFAVDEDTARIKSSYALFPPLLDSGINLGLLREEDPFLPLGFESANFPGGMPDSGYCWVVPVDPEDFSSGDLRVYDITFVDSSGQVAGRVRRYSVSRVRDAQNFLVTADAPNLHSLSWKQKNGTGADVFAGDCSNTMIVFNDPGAGSTEPFSNSETLLASRLPLVATLLSRGARICDVEKELDSEEFAKRVISQILSSGVERIVYVCPEDRSRNDISQGQPDLDGVTESFYFIKELVSARVQDGLELIVITQNGQLVTGDEEIQASARAAASAILCYAREYTHIPMRVIDIDAVSTEVLQTGSTKLLQSVRANEVFELTIGELGTGESAPAGFDQPEPAAEVPHERVGNEPEVVLVTGGLGGMAMAFADILTARHPELRIALLNRQLGAEDSQNMPLCIDNRLAAFGDRRDRVKLIKADVANDASLRAGLSSIRETIGPISGVIHTAGIPGDGFALTKEWSDFVEVMAPKACGITLLDRLTADDPVRFFVLCSSMTSVLGAAGQSDYAAANAYLDAYAAGMCQRGRNAVSINWTGWSESGMAKKHGITGSGYFMDFVTDAEGANLLLQAIESPAAQVIAGSFIPTEVALQYDDIDRVLNLPKTLTERPRNDLKRRNLGRSRSRPTSVSFTVEGLQGRKLNPTEHSVAEAWCVTLGSETLAMTDKFFESGGNSLLASRLQVELDERFPGVVNIADIFVHPTIEDLSDYIDSKTSWPHSSGKDPSAVSPDSTTKGPVASMETAESLSELFDKFLDGRISADEVMDQ